MRKRDLVIVAGAQRIANELRHQYLDANHRAGTPIPWRRIRVVTGRQPNLLHGTSNAVVWIHWTSIIGMMRKSQQGVLARTLRTLQVDESVTLVPIGAR